jgi:hypothetical protein
LPGVSNFYKRTIPSGYGIIGLQEVDLGTSKVGDLNVPQIIDNAMGWGWVHRFGWLMWTDGGLTGNTVVTNATVLETQCWRFPGTRHRLAGSDTAMATVLGWAGFRDISLHRNSSLTKPPSLAFDGQLDYITTSTSTTPTSDWRSRAARLAMLPRRRWCSATTWRWWQSSAGGRNKSGCATAP